MEVGNALSVSAGAVNVDNESVVSIVSVEAGRELDGSVEFMGVFDGDCVELVFPSR